MNVKPFFVFLAEPFLFKHFRYNCRIFPAHSVRVPFSHHTASMESCVNANHVQQTCWAHWPAKFFHNFINVLIINSVTYQTCKSCKIRKQHSIYKKTRTVIYHDRTFSHCSCKCNRGSNCCFRTFFTTDHFNKGHSVNRIKKVHAAKLFRTFKSFSQFCN